MPPTAFVIGCVCSALAGVLLATQSGLNSTLGGRSGRSFASVVSFSTGLAALVLFFLVDVYALGHLGPSKANVSTVPWWAWFGGPLGAFYVAIVIIFAPVLGPGTLLAIFVTAHLCMAVLMDSLGLVGFRRRRLHWARLLGLVLMVCGVALVTYFDGTRGHATHAVATNGTGVAKDGAGGPTPAPAAVAMELTAERAAPEADVSGGGAGVEVSVTVGPAGGIGDGGRAPGERSPGSNHR